MQPEDLSKKLADMKAETEAEVYLLDFLKSLMMASEEMKQSMNISREEKNDRGKQSD